MKNTRALSLLFVANSISGFAQGISMLAIPWYFTSIIDQPGAFGVMYAIVTFLTIFWSLYSGTLIDRYPRKNIFLFTSIGGGLILGSVSLYGYLHGETPLPLVMLVFATTMFVYNIHYPTLYAFGQELTEKVNYRKVNSLIEIIGQSTNMIAGAIAAILLSGTDANNMFNLLGLKVHLPFAIERWKMHEIFLMDGITYMLAIILILFIKYTPTVELRVDKEAILKRMKMGFSFLQGKPALFLFGVCSYTIFVVLLIEVHFLLPMYVDNHLHEAGDVYSSAEVYYTFGALATGLMLSKVMQNVNEIKAIVIKMIATTVVMILCAFTQSVGIFFFVSFVMGITNSGTRILRVTYLFNHVPNNIMGRASSVFHVINIVMRTALILLFSLPFFAEGFNVKWAYFISGIFVLVFTIPIIANYKRLVIGDI